MKFVRICPIEISRNPIYLIYLLFTLYIYIFLIFFFIRKGALGLFLYSLFLLDLRTKLLYKNGNRSIGSIPCYRTRALEKY